MEVELKEETKNNFEETKRVLGESSNEAKLFKDRLIKLEEALKEHQLREEVTPDFLSCYCLVLSCCVVLCRIVSCRAVFCLVLPCRAVSCIVLSVWSCLV